MANIIDVLMGLLQEAPVQNTDKGLIGKAPKNPVVAGGSPLYDERQNALLGALATPASGGLALNPVQAAVPSANFGSVVPAPPYDEAQNALVGLLGQLGGNGLKVNQLSTPMAMPVRTATPVPSVTAPEAKPVIPASVKAESVTKVVEEGDGLNAGQRRVRDEAAKENSVYRPSETALANGASNNQVRVVRTPDGRIEFTNVGTPQYSATKVDPNTQEQAQPFTIDSIDTALEEMKGEKDTLVLAQKIKTLSNNAISYRDGVYDNYLQAARGSLGIDTMNDTLQRARQIDQQRSAADPMYVPIAAATIEKDILAKEELAQKMAKDRLERNITVRGIENKMKLISPELAIYGQRAGFAEESELKDAAIADSFTPDMTANLMATNPDADGKASTLASRYKRLDNTDKAIIAANPIDIPRLALIHPESKVARTLVAAQLKAANLSDEDSIRIVGRMQKMMSDPKELQRAGQLAGVTKEEKSILMPFQGTGKEEALLHKQRQAEVVMRALAREETATFVENATKWLPMSDPGIEAAVNKVRLAGAPANLPNIANAYVSAGTTPQERNARRARIAEVTQQAALTRSKTPVGAVNVTELMSVLPRAMSNLDKLTSNVGSALNAATYPLGEDRKNTFAEAAQYPLYAPMMVGKNIARDIGGGFNFLFDWVNQPSE